MQLRRFGNRKKKWWGLGGNAATLVVDLNKKRIRLDPLLVSLVCHLTPFIDPFLKLTGDQPFTTVPFQIKKSLSPAQLYVGATLRCEPRLKPGIDWEQLNETPEALRFQLTWHDRDCVAPDWAFEIGRFITKQNEVGLIKSIQTGIAFNDNDLRWPRGDSLWHTRDLSLNNGFAFVKWALMIESVVDGQSDPKDMRYIDMTAITTNWVDNLPGSVHPEMMPWDSMLFLWGQDHAVHWRCPPGSLVSLWMIWNYDGSHDAGIRIASGMMKGYTQIQSSDRTYENMTRAY